MRVRTTRPISLNIGSNTVILPQGCELSIHTIDEESQDADNNYFTFEGQHFQIYDDDFVCLG